jgi:NADPH-dependent glutamate synthase beta subunit-like oxidoreductase/NAD-dependent dihydropyrimidine dehydrogenase PreA subunit
MPGNNGSAIEKGKTLTTDLIVIGGGGSGLAAAVTAAEKAAKVIVLEKRNCTGGNTGLASGMFAAESPVQKRAMIDASRDELFRAMMEWAHWKIDPRIVRAYVDKSGDTIRWLEEQGCAFELMPFFPNQTPVVTHILSKRAAVTDALRRSCDRLGVTIHVRTEAKRILKENDRVIGIVASNRNGEFTIIADTVIIATGGYGGNKELIRKYCSNYDNKMFCIGLPNMGDGLRMGIEAGAATEGLGMLQIEGPCSPRSLRLMIDGGDSAKIPMMLTQIATEPYAIWVNNRGVRFMDETIGNIPFVAANGLARQPGSVCYGLLDSGMIQRISETGILLARGPAARLLGSRVPGLESELRLQADKGTMCYAQIDQELCNGCGICVDSCPLDIIGLDTVVSGRNEITACRSACPAGVDIRRYLYFLKQGMVKEAISVITETMPFAAITGRVCPHLCESECARKEVDEALNINAIERFLGDLQLEEKREKKVKLYEEKTAIVGSGPAGLACAYFLAELGYQVTVFEAMPQLGGMLRTGIPEYRLPREILDKQIKLIGDVGVEFIPSTRIGTDIPLEKLMEEYNALFIATGNQLSRRIFIDGIESDRVLWGLDFLRDINLHKKMRIAENIVVIGGGNVAVDVALSALRLGARNVRMVCLEQGEVIPAYREEIEQALSEGIIIEEGWGPYRVLAEEIELARCLSLCDEKGNFNPRLDNKETRLVKADMFIFAIGQTPDLSFIPKNVTITKDGAVQVNPITGETTLPGVFAGGDVVSEVSTVAASIAAGKRAADSIDRYLRNEDIRKGRDIVAKRVEKPPKEGIHQCFRVEKPLLSVDQRINNFTEVKVRLDEEMVYEESLRCMTCGSRALINPVEECRLCQSCERNCPQKAISIRPAKTLSPYVRIANSWEEIAAWIGVDSGILKTTIDEYNLVCEKGYDPVFMKDHRHLVPLLTPPYYAIKLGVDYLDTIGGIKINERMEVINKQGKPVPGLYAAGIDTGGWSGDTYCVQTTGTTFAFAINSGRIAAENGVEKVLRHNPEMSNEDKRA